MTRPIPPTRAATPALSAEGVTRRYGAQSVVCDASLTLAPGTLTALLGPSGAGKSTFLRLLAGLEPVDDGTIRLGDRIVSSPVRTTPAEHRRTGLIFQDFALFPHLRALDNVMFGLDHLPRDEARRRAAAWLDQLSLGHRSAAYPHELSGGEQQRVAIARALAPDPEAVLMDEPFSGLDPALEDGVRQAAMAALATSGKPALIVTHDPVGAMAMAQQVAVMDRGRILQVGDAETVYREPNSLAVAYALGPLQTLDHATCPASLLSDLPPVDPAATLGLRSHDIVMTAEGGTPARVVGTAFLGGSRSISLEIDASPNPLRLVASVSSVGPAPKTGDTVQIRLVPQGRFIFDPQKS